jgi:DNA-binding cell septation regulator SpoVG
MEITYYTKMTEEASSVKAEFGIKIPEWNFILNRLKLIRSKNGGFFVTAPSMKKDEKYEPYWDFSDPEIKRRFFDAALKVVETHIANLNAGNIPEKVAEEFMF